MKERKKTTILKCDVKLLLGVSTSSSFRSLTFDTVLTTAGLKFRD